MRDYSVRRTECGYLVVNEKRLYELTGDSNKELTCEEWKTCHTHLNSKRMAMLIADCLENLKVPNFTKVSPDTRVLLLDKCLRLCGNKELFEAISFKIKNITSHRKRRKIR